MNARTSHAIPLFAIVIVVVWLTWTNYALPSAVAPAGAKVARLDPGLLTPALAPVSARDPFFLAALAEEKPAPVASAVGAPVAAANAAPTGAVAAAKKPASGSSANRWKAAWSGIARYFEQKGKEAVALAQQEAQTRDSIRDQARLSATAIGSRRLATLNDRIFEEGDVIDSLGTVTGPIVLAQVRPGAVTLRHVGTSAVVTLTMGTGPLRPAATAARPSPVPSRPAAAARTTKPRQGTQARQGSTPRRAGGGRT